MTDYYKMMSDVVGSYGDGVEFARQRQRQIEADERAKTEWDQKQAAWQREEGLRRGVDKAWEARQRLDNGVYDGGNTTGMSDASARTLHAAGGQELLDTTARLGNAEEASLGLTPPYQVSSPGAPTVRTRKATERDILDANLGIALAKRDLEAESRYRAEGKLLDWTEGVKQYAAQWDALTDKQREAMITEASQNAAIPGHGTWVPGKGKDGGYMWYTPPGKDPIRLSAKEAKNFFVFGHMAAVDPDRARKEMDAAGDRIRAVYREIFAEQAKGAEVNNKTSEAMRKQKHDEDMLGLQREELSIKRSAAKRHNLALDRFDEQVQAADNAAGLLQGYRTAQNAGAKDAVAIYGPLYEAAAARAQGVGIKLPGLKGAPGVDPEKYASVLKDLVGAGYSPTDAAMQADKMFGIAPEAGNLVGRLAELSAAKDKGKAAPPKDTKPKTNWAERPPLFDPVQQSAEKDMEFARRTSLGLTR